MCAHAGTPIADEFRFRPRSTRHPAWGVELTWAAAESYVARLLSINRGGVVSGRESGAGCTLHVQEGELEVELHAGDGGRAHGRVASGESLMIEGGCLYRLQALTDATVVEVAAPPERPPSRA